MIVESKTVTEDNINFETVRGKGGDDVLDKVFILSSKEAYKYLGSPVMSGGIWWLRDPGLDNKYAC